MLNQIVSIIEKADPVEEDVAEVKNEKEESTGPVSDSRSASGNDGSDMVAVDVGDLEMQRERGDSLIADVIAIQSGDSSEVQSSTPTKSGTPPPALPHQAMSPTYTTVTEQGATEAYRCKLLELNDAISNLKDFKTQVLRCVESYQCELEKCGRGPVTEGLLVEIRDYLLPTAQRSVSEVTAHFRCVEQEIRKEAIGDRALETLCGYLQNNVKGLEDEVTLLKDRIRSMEHEQQKLSEPQQISLQPEQTGGASPDMRKLKKRLEKAQSESSEKQAMISVLYNEKEDLRRRLEVCEARLDVAQAIPQAKVDDSQFFQSLAERGKIGSRVTAAVTRIDTYTLSLGKVAYSNAVVRVLIALYLILIHIWLFYVISSSVHMLPSLADSVHEHEMHFNNNHN